MPQNQYGGPQNPQEEDQNVQTQNQGQNLHQPPMPPYSMDGYYYGYPHYNSGYDMDALYYDQQYRNGSGGNNEKQVGHGDAGESVSDYSKLKKSNSGGEGFETQVNHYNATRMWMPPPPAYGGNQMGGPPPTYGANQMGGPPPGYGGGQMAMPPMGYYFF